jgi:hypothetical protein
MLVQKGSIVSVVIISVLPVPSPCTIAVICGNYRQNKGFAP